MSSASTVRAPINPAVLRWAIESAGFNREDIARSVGVDVTRLTTWEQGSDRPTLNQLRDLANKVKRPYPVFFLQRAPEGADLLPDLRTRGSLSGEYSPQLRIEIRRAKYYQSLVADHRPALVEGADLPIANLRDSPREAAAAVRNWLGVDLAAQTQFRSSDRGFSQWREVFLERGVLSYVFRLEALEQGETAEALGFCLPANVAPLVAVNGDGAPAEKVFGLFHELGHLVLRTSGVSSTPSSSSLPSPTEQWCNRFANRCVLPDDKSVRTLIEQLPQSLDAFDAYQRVATKLRVSRYVVLNRAREEGLIPAGIYDQMRTFFTKVDEERREDDRRKKLEKRAKDKADGKTSRGPSPIDMSLSRRGAAAAARIAQRWSEGQLSDDEAADLLEVDPSHLESLLHKAFQRSSTE